MYQVIIFIHILVAVCLIGLVLIQQGKGATVGAAFGSGASQTVFGSRGSGSFLFRFTMGLAAIFFITSLSLNYLTMHTYQSQKSFSLPNSTKIDKKSVVPADPYVMGESKGEETRLPFDPSKSAAANR
jgi:preprotein translocase subunit SecG